VPPEFQAELASAWKAYHSVTEALAADDLKAAKSAIAPLRTAVMSIKDETLSPKAKKAWKTEQANLQIILTKLAEQTDIKAMRTEFAPLSQEFGVLAKSFGFGGATPVYELHCPMAFRGKGAIWYQQSSKVRNPYFGSTMLSCADRVDKIEQEPAVKTKTPGTDATHAGPTGH